MSSRRGRPAARRARPSPQRGSAVPSAPARPSHGGSAKRPLKTLERVLSKAGVGSRGEARRWVADGRVRVNGRVVCDPDHWVDMARDHVQFDGDPLVVQPRVYLVLNKPTGYLTTSRDPEGRPTIYDLLGDVDTLVRPVGRLDLDTSGVLLLTNDNQFADRVTNPESHVPKTYLVEASAVLTEEQLQHLREGVTLKDGPTRPALVTRRGEGTHGTRFEIVLTEGRNRQVRRMVEAIGAQVVTLERSRIGTLGVGGLGPGAWRALTAGEIQALLRDQRL